MRIAVARPAAAVACAVALGTLLFSARVAPLLFDAMPDDRARAGRIAARAFERAYLVAGLAAVGALGVALAAASSRKRLEIGLAAAMAAAAALELGWIAPAIASRGVGWPWTFASLHRAGGALHVALGALALVLAWLFVSRERA